MKILLLGKFGQLGSELACVLTNLGDVIAPQRFNTALPGNMLDLSMLRDTVQRIKPNLIGKRHFRTVLTA